MARPKTMWLTRDDNASFRSDGYNLHFTRPPPVFEGGWHIRSGDISCIYAESFGGVCLAPGEGPVAVVVLRLDEWELCG